MSRTKRLFTQNPDRANEQAFKQLRRVLQSKRVLAFVGAGVSRRVGFPLWSTLLEELHDRAVSKQYLPEDTQYLRDQADFLWRAQYYRELLGDVRFNQVLQENFVRRYTPDAFLRTLITLPFRHFLTTNYDDVLTRTHRHFRRSEPRVLDWAEEHELRGFINELSDGRANGRAYVHLHGRIDKKSGPKNLVLTDSDYADRYLRSEDTRRKLFTIFATQRVAFIGFSMNDPDLQSLIRLVHSSIGGESPRHFAILAVTEADGHPDLIRKQWREKYGIEPVFYPVVKDHKALEAVVRRLKTGRGQLPPLRFTPNVVPTRPVTKVDPEDPQKNQWGGISRGHGRQVSAAILDGSEGYYNVRITLKSTTRQPLSDPIVFHLHDTFDPDTWEPDEIAGDRMSAFIDVETYGAFTVGVEENGGATRLEYDLARIKGAPADFREG